METTEKVLSELRQRIDVEYREAISAFEKLKRYLVDGSAGPESSAPAPTRTVSRFVMNAEAGEIHVGAKSKRQTVLGALTNELQSVAQISRQTGLTPKDIRGVLYAQGLFELVEKGRDRRGVGFRRRA